MATGDKISIEEPLVILVGNGERDSLEDVNYVDPEYSKYEEGNGETDDFQQVTKTEEQPAKVLSDGKKE